MSGIAGQLCVEIDMRRPVRRLAGVALGLALTAAGPSAAAQEHDRITAAGRAATRAALAGTAAAAPAAWNQIMGAGDISADPETTSTADLATSELLRQAQPATVFTAGDNQYPWGQIEDFTDPDGYAGTWGREPVKAVTCAAVGNHEYLDPRPGPAGFLDYFRPNCPHRPDIEYARTAAGAVIPTAYAFRPAPGSGWWAYVLDSQCTHHGSPLTEFGPSCGRTGNMLNWFRAHMAAHPARCRLAIWHHPRWITGDARATEDAKVYELYSVSAYKGRISLIVNGHSHSYQRFASMTADGQIDPTFTAPRTIVAGTGGAQLIDFTAGARPGTRAMFLAHGVLRVTLNRDHWVSEFDGIDGGVRDRASARC
jgi:acid phosphatase type 7